MTQPAKTFEQVKEVIDRIVFRPETLDVFTLSTYQGSEVMYVQHSYLRPDSFTGTPERGYGRKWSISPFATDSEIVLTCLKAAITNAEHEVREDFHYRGARIFHPHQDVEALVAACKKVDARQSPVNPADRAVVLG